MTYTFTVGNVQVMQPSDIVEVEMAVSGAPSIAPLEYTPDDEFTDNACTKTLSIDWSRVVIKEPGVYVWEVT